MAEVVSAADAAPEVAAEVEEVAAVTEEEEEEEEAEVTVAAVEPDSKEETVTVSTDTKEETEKGWNLEKLQKQAVAHVTFLREQALAPAAVVLLAITIMSPSTVLNWLIWPVYQIILQIIGIAVGVGLGLGLATHVYDILDHWKERQDRDNHMNAPSLSRSQSRVNTSGSGASGNNNGNIHTLNAPHRSQYYSNKLQSGSSFQLQDEQTYESLMAAAGYSTNNNTLNNSSNTNSSNNTNTSTSNNNNNNNDTTNKILRAHVLRSTSPFWNLNYPFTTVESVEELTAVDRMKDLWPTLPSVVNEQLGRFIEHILRDYIACWYNMVDAGCKYENAAQAQKERKEKEAEASANPEQKDDAAAAAAAAAAATVAQQEHQQQQQFRKMVYSVALHRRVPFLDRLYESMAILFGNLATRVEHVNVLEVVLLKWTRVLAHTFKVYRVLRRQVRSKALAHEAAQNPDAARAAATTRSFRKSGKRRQQAAAGESLASSLSQSKINNATEATNTSTCGNHNSSTTNTASAPEEGRIFGAVSEIAMTKEFLFAGKLHRAITFGLDVPSLLFADASGRECGTGTDNKSDTDKTDNRTAPDKTVTDDQVLEERLYGTSLLKECELDYNRVVGHRMVRALLPRADFGSPIVSSLLTEIMGSSVLTSIMSCFCPEYLNGWIIKGLGAKTPPEGAATEGDDGEEEKDPLDDNDEGLMRGWSHGQGQSESRAGNQPDSGDPVGHDSIEMTHGFDNNSEQPSPEKQKRDFAKQGPLTKEEKPNTTKYDGPKDLTPQKKTHVKEESVTFQLPEISAAEGGEDIITQLAMSLIDLQQHMDFEECRDASSNRQEVRIDWDDDGCRAAVLRLVLVIEAALTEGRCTYRHKVSENVEDDLDGSDGDGEELDDLDDSERPVEVTLPDYESATLSQILMEMTSDIEAFEERVATDNVLAAGEGDTADNQEVAEDYQPTATEQSTLRTLIAAWLHTGQVYRTVTVLVQAQTTILAPYYNPQAFLRSRANSSAFVRQLKALDGVDILVDTMTVLASPRLDETTGDELNALAKQTSGRRVRVPEKSKEEASPASPSFPAQYMGMSSSTPRHLDFHRNEAFAASLRSERERRAQSWETLVHDNSEGLPIICRTKGSTEADMAWHKDLHHIARIFYTGTNLVATRDAARRKSSLETDGASQSDATDPEAVQTSLLTVETACPRRRIEVPDDDSSFLLRAQVSTTVKRCG
jgi:hypothetical protein